MKLITISIMLILLFVLVVGCVSTNNPINNPTNNTSINSSTLPINSGYVVYTNDSYNFSIQYPVNWTIAENEPDNYSFPPDTVKNVVTFYPPNKNKSSVYDSFTVAWDNNSLYSSTPVTLDDYSMYGLLHYYTELPNITVINGGRVNVSSYPAISVNFSYELNGVKLQGMTLFIIGSNEYMDGINGLYHAEIYRLEYRTSNDTFNDYFGTAQEMINTFRLSKNQG